MGVAVGVGVGENEMTSTVDLRVQARIMEKLSTATMTTMKVMDRFLIAGLYQENAGPQICSGQVLISTSSA
jgi:hypothetical protein